MVLYIILWFSLRIVEILLICQIAIYMLAQAKNRLDDIIEIYEVLRNTGLKIDFHIAGVKSRYCESIQMKSIIWMVKAFTMQKTFSTFFTPSDKLKSCKKMERDLYREGVRLWRLGKKLLTNNAFIKGEPFFNSNFISTFTTPEDIDMDFLRHI